MIALVMLKGLTALMWAFFGYIPTAYVINWIFPVLEIQTLTYLSIVGWFITSLLALKFLMPKSDASY